ncbi:MAG: O-antigen ligase family protein [Pyrinomonadaceae bacterium]
MIGSKSNIDVIEPCRSGDIGLSTAAIGNGIVPMILCLVSAMTPLVFVAQLAEPYTAAKEILVQAGTATAALLWLLTVRSHLWSVPLTPAWVSLLVLVIVGSGSLLWSSNQTMSFDEGRRMATYVLLFATALNVMGRADARGALGIALTLAGAIEAVYVLWQYSTGDPFFATGALAGKWQTFGTLGNPNWVGEFLAVAALVSVGLLFDLRQNAAADMSARPYAGHLTLAALLLMVLALAATLARGAWLALIIGCLAFWLVRRYGKVARSGLTSYIVTVAVTCAAAIVVILLPLLSNQAAIKHLFNLKSINGRILMSTVAGTMIGAAPWTGHGLGTFGLQFPNYQAEILSQPWAVTFIPNASFTSYAHNDYLQLWAELGVFGLLAFGSLMWIVLRRGRKLAGDPVALGCWAAVISLLVNAAVAFPLHLPASLILFVILIAVVESSAVGKTVGGSSTPFAARAAVVLLTLTLCFSAYGLAYDRFVSEAALWRADTSVRNGQWNEAEDDILTATRHAPTRPGGLILLARLNLERGEFAEALVALEKAGRLGFDEEIFDLKAKALEALGRSTEAVAVLNELIRLRPDLQWPSRRLSVLASEEKKQ